MLPRLFSGNALLYAGGALAALLLASNLAWWAQASGLRASLREARADAQVTAIERDAWKAKAAELAEANRAGQDVMTALRAEIDLAQGEARRLEAEGRQAIAAARADAAAAEGNLRQFRERYARQRAAPDCDGALAAVQQHCPQFEGY